MANYSVTFSCGHTETVQLIGPEADRQRKIKWYGAEGRCQACRQNERREAAAVETAARREALAGEALPALDGSVKQIAWAEDLRLAVAPTLVAIRNQLAANERAAGTPEAKAVAEMIGLALAQASAKWWIERTQGGDAGAVLGGVLDRRLAAGKIDAALADRIRPALSRFAAAVKARG